MQRISVLSLCLLRTGSSDLAVLKVKTALLRQRHRSQGYLILSVLSDHDDATSSFEEKPTDVCCSERSPIPSSRYWLSSQRVQPRRE